jgi:hypothetical protein
MATTEDGRLVMTPYESYTLACREFNRRDWGRANLVARSLLAWAKTEWTPGRLSHGRLASTVEIERVSRERINAIASLPV